MTEVQHQSLTHKTLPCVILYWASSPFYHPFNLLIRYYVIYDGGSTPVINTQGVALRYFILGFQPELFLTQLFIRHDVIYYVPSTPVINTQGVVLCYFILGFQPELSSI